VYVTFVSGFAGWCGSERLTFRNLAVVVVIPIALAAALFLHQCIRNPRPALLLVLAAPLALGSVVLGVMGLLLAWSVAETVGAWESVWARVLVPAVACLVGALVALFVYEKRLRSKQ
jgi:hypothetical protein